MSNEKNKKGKPLSQAQAEALVIEVDKYALDIHVWYDKNYGGVATQDEGTNPPPPPPPPPHNN